MKTSSQFPRIKEITTSIIRVYKESNISIEAEEVHISHGLVFVTCKILDETKPDTVFELSSKLKNVLAVQEVVISPLPNHSNDALFQVKVRDYSVVGESLNELIASDIFDGENNISLVAVFSDVNKSLTKLIFS